MNEMTTEELETAARETLLLLKLRKPDASLDEAREIAYVNSHVAADWLEAYMRVHKDSCSDPSNAGLKQESQED